MRKISALLLAAAVAGCGPASAPAPRDSEAFEMDLVQQLVIDLPGLKVGEWALYFLKKRGDPGMDPVKYSVVEEEGAALWVEQQRTVDGRRLVAKSKLDRTGKLLDQWYGESGGMPARTYAGPGGKAAGEDAPPPRRDSSAAQDQTDRKTEVIEAGGKTYICTKITTTLTYPDGRKSTMINWCSKDVPLGPKDVGGLVRRTFGRFSMELADHGTDARPELSLPILKK